MITREFEEKNKGGTPDKNAPVWCMDSGVGGISVLREAARLLPQERFVFFGDSANAPYGMKTTEEVRELTLNAVADADMHYHPKAFVIACNTATTAAVKVMRSLYPGRIIVGIEPALKPAALGVQQESGIVQNEKAENAFYRNSGEGCSFANGEYASEAEKKTLPGGSQAGHKRRVLVLATPLTIKEEKFHALLKHYEDMCDVIPLGCPGLMEYAESGNLDSPETDAFVKNLIGQYAGQIDAVVLGCTHYPFLRGPIARALSLPDSAVYDGGYGTAKNLKRLLSEAGLLRDAPAAGQAAGESADGCADESSELERRGTNTACNAYANIDDAWLDSHVFFECSLPGEAGEERIALCRKLMK